MLFVASLSAASPGVARCGIEFLVLVVELCCVVESARARQRDRISAGISVEQAGARGFNLIPRPFRVSFVVSFYLRRASKGELAFVSS